MERITIGTAKKKDYVTLEFYEFSTLVEVLRETLLRVELTTDFRWKTHQLVVATKHDALAIASMINEKERL